MEVITKVGEETEMTGAHIPATFEEIAPDVDGNRNPETIVVHMAIGKFVEHMTAFVDGLEAISSKEPIPIEVVLRVTDVNNSEITKPHNLEDAAAVEAVIVDPEDNVT